MFKYLKIILFFVISWVQIPLFAQLNNDNAKEDLTALAQKYKTFNSLKINYAFCVEDEGKTSPIERGELVFKENSYKLTIDNQEIYCDGTNIWSYLKKENEVSIYLYEESDEDLINPAKILSGWDKNYNAKFIKEEFLDGRKLRVIDLTPIHRKSYYKIRFFVDMAKKEVVKIYVYEKDNSTLQYTIEKFTTNMTLPGNFFTFNPAVHKGIQINDMR